MQDKSYYKILGVSENATLDEIKKAFRALAMRYHPDRNQDNQKQAEEKFKEISESYYVLSDEKRRQEYDAYRKGYAYAGTGGGFQGTQGFDFEEILKRFSGSGASGRRARGRTVFSNGMFDNIFDIFSHMSQNGYTQYAYSNGDEDLGVKEVETNTGATLSIPRHVALSGGEVKFNHNGKNITLKIKPGTKSGQKLRMKDQGSLCPYCRHHGDLIITIRVK